MHEPGTLSRGENGNLCIKAEDENYFIPAGDIRSLLFAGKPTPLIAPRCGTGGKGLDIIEGYAVIGSGGRSVFIYSRAGHFLTPMVNFLRVARGEASRYLKRWSKPDGFLVPEGITSQRKYRLRGS